MHDIKYIRENPEVFDKALSLRGISKMSAKILSLDEERRSAILAAETATAEQNKACLLYTSPSPRDDVISRMPSSA